MSFACLLACERVPAAAGRVAAAGGRAGLLAAAGYTEGALDWDCGTPEDVLAAVGAAGRGT
jgi:hypothetical protein